jgi:hypothetical protein
MIIQRVPKWEEISQEKYERIVNKRYSERVVRSFVGFTNLNASELSDMFDSDLRRDAVFDRPGILSRINGEAKVIGYRYYKKVGDEMQLLVGHEDIEVIKKLGIDPNNVTWKDLEKFVKKRRNK